MSDDRKPRDAARPSTYQDALQPAAEELGKLVQIMARTVNMALAPVHVMVWSYEVFRDTVATPMAGRMRRSMGAVGEVLEEVDVSSATGAAGQVIGAVAPALFPRRSASDDLAYDPELEIRHLGEDEASSRVDSDTEAVSYQFDFSVSERAIYTLQTKSAEDLVMGLFRSEPPYRRVTYKDDGGEGRNPLIQRELEPDTYFVVVRRFGGESFKASFEVVLAREDEEADAEK